MRDLFLHLWTHYHYVIYIALMVIGLYAVLAKGNLVKKVIGLNLLQTAVFLFYISIGRIEGGTAPVYWDEKPAGVPYENPVPHVLMLTAIVVGVSITAVALALIVRIKDAYGTIDEGEILALDESDEAREAGEAGGA
jgi:multicomponent Na+:H+ antiporter subunit C